jgi:hypothetical protein
MTGKPSGKTGKQAMERARQMGVSFPLERMIEDQLEDERREKARAMERSRAEVYGMPVETIIESAKQAYPPVKKSKTPPPPEEPVWTSIEDQMANPMGRKQQKPGRRR